MLAPITRRFALFALSVLSLLLAFAPLAHGETSSEAFVRKNLGIAFQQLNDKSLDDAERAARFAALMDEFADLPRIAEFVLGKYSAKLRQDPALYREWRDTFREFAVTVYQGQLDQYTGESFKVLPSPRETRRNDKRYSIVSTQIVRDNGKVLDVDWRLIETDGNWRVVDVALKSGESIVWLSLTQQTEFLSILRKNNGDIPALIEEVKQRTASIRSMMERRRA